jgi:hypothetical protein
VLESNGKEVFLLSEKILDCVCFDKDGKTNDFEQSSIKQWLNGKFKQRAFGGKDVGEVTLLSIADVKKHSVELGTKQAVGTAFAKSDKTENDGKIFEYEGYGCWWLKDKGSGGASLAAIVYNLGLVYDYGYYVYHDYFGVRPALRVQLPTQSTETTQQQQQFPSEGRVTARKAIDVLFGAEKEEEQRLTEKEKTDVVYKIYVPTEQGKEQREIEIEKFERANAAARERLTEQESLAREIVKEDAFRNHPAHVFVGKKPGDIVTGFGTYPQNADGKDKTPIQWRVLANDGKKAFIIADKIMAVLNFRGRE